MPEMPPPVESIKPFYPKRETRVIHAPKPKVAAPEPTTRKIPVAVEALPHPPNPEEKVEPEPVRFMRRDGWWLVPVVLLALSVVPIGMAFYGNGGVVVDLLVLLIRLIAVLLVPGSVVGIIVSLIKRKPRWALAWAVVLIVGVISVLLLFILQ